MKIKHYRAPDMRQALRLVREAQGVDAVIVSSHRVNGGVEVVAAVDYEESPGDTSVASTAQRDVRTLADAGGISSAQRDVRMNSHAQADVGAVSSAQRDARLQSHPQADVSVNEELRTLRRMLETQLATLAWNDLTRRSPVVTELLKELTELGLAQDLAAELAASLPARLELSEAHRLALAMLARRIEVSDERWLDHGGVVAFVGATGVGKTTLVAKLAARWVLRHGPRDLALISADSMRIGAQEQMHTLGRLLGAAVYSIDGAVELAPLLDHLSEKRLVLIDTAGLSQRDPRLPEELATLAAASERIEASLVLSAAAQAGAIEEAVERFAAARPATCVLTKLDEAVSLGGAISTLIRSRLPVAWLSDGQCVPEDLSLARAHQLIARAVELSRKAGAKADEDLLQRRFGALAHAMA